MYVLNPVPLQLNECTGVLITTTEAQELGHTRQISFSAARVTSISLLIIVQTRLYSYNVLPLIVQCRYCGKTLNTRSTRQMQDIVGQAWCELLLT